MDAALEVYGYEDDDAGRVSVIFLLMLLQQIFLQRINRLLFYFRWQYFLVPPLIMFSFKRKRREGIMNRFGKKNIFPLVKYHPVINVLIVYGYVG